MVRLLAPLSAIAVLGTTLVAAEPRARDLGIPFDGTPGKWNAITDVPGVEVGHTTLIEGDSVRTGVTAILPRGKGEGARKRCFGGFFALNGYGEMTGTHWIEESGIVDGPILTTDTNDVGVVRDAVVRYAGEHLRLPGDDEEVWSMPIVAETWSGDMNPLYLQPVRPEHVFQAIDSASGGAVAEGSVGGGTGMRSFGFKSGIGTSSRVLAGDDGGCVVGVLVQTNLGAENGRLLRIGGVPVGEELSLRGRPSPAKDGSIIIVIGTDAPLLPHQLKRLARRAALGQARTGAIGADSSGDIYIAFSTAPLPPADASGLSRPTMLADDRIDTLFEAVIGATEEAIVNSLVAARTMSGDRKKTFEGLPLDAVREILRRHDRLAR
jgi:L-aminopeptidase/D-esterase-like protein